MRLLIALLCLFTISCADKKQSIKSEQVAEEVEALPAYFIQYELIIKLAPDMRPAELVTEMADISLELKKTISAISRLYLYSYDTEKISPHKVLEYVQASDGVEVVQFDKKLEEREY